MPIRSSTRVDEQLNEDCARSLSVSFDGRSVTYGFGELDTLVPTYAPSILATTLQGGVQLFQR